MERDRRNLQLPTQHCRLPFSIVYTIHSFIHLPLRLIRRRLGSGEGMDSEQRRKRRRLKAGVVSLWPPPPPQQLFSLKYFLLCLSFFVFLLFVSSDRYLVSPAAFRPSSTLSLLSKANAAANRSLNHRLLRVEGRVQFPDHLLLLLLAHPGGLPLSEKLECVYYRRSNYTPGIGGKELMQALPLLSADAYDDFRSIVRCPLPPANYSAVVDLLPRGYSATLRSSPPDQPVPSWHKVAYEAILDGDTAVVFVKGLKLRAHRRSDPSRYSCHFWLGNRDRGNEPEPILTTEAITAAQEVVRCLLPRRIHISPNKANGIQVTIGVPSNFHGGVGKSLVRVPLPSMAKIYTTGQDPDERPNTNRLGRKYDVCACTMMWNQAPSLREWIVYHSWLGIQRWFIYDNNSDDDMKDVIEELNLENHNVSRHIWPWIKSQEAGFSHCVLKAKEDCQWVGFFDVDEFFYFQLPRWPGQGSLRAFLANFSSYGEIRTGCHSFGPSGLTSHPPQGVTIGYTCRLQQPERHKSFVQPDALDFTLLNEVHHFRLKEGFRYLNVPESIAVINHYKYQVWETFRTKFYRRVSSYVVDWQENQNTGSKDRAPGLGTEPIEPPDWRQQFCEVWDTGLKNFVLAKFADPATGKLPWEKSHNPQRH